jgi:16S rRNA (cytosine967-C5)-methyltransferase
MAQRRSAGGGGASRIVSRPSSTTSADTRQAAIDALVRIDRDGAYANLVVPRALDAGTFEARDRAFITDLVYGTTRMKRACDHLVDRFLLTPTVDPPVRAALRVGAYQLAFAGVAPHAAVDATVGAVPRRVRGLVNAVLRKVAAHPIGPDEWPDDATRLSYPDWIVQQLTEDLGGEDALAALAKMNEPATVTVRADGYRQDPGSQAVAALVDAGPGLRVADTCAAPGGKATAIASTGAWVAASDMRVGRAGLVAENRTTLGLEDRLAVVVADGRALPYRPRSFDRVLVDAPCSGLGALRRRADARWRIMPDAVDRLADLQVELVLAGAELLVPGGELVYAVCTLTVAESTGVDNRVAAQAPHLHADEGLPAPWVAHGRGGRLLPQAIDSDGMCAFRYRRAG